MKNPVNMARIRGGEPGAPRPPRSRLAGVGLVVPILAWLLATGSCLLGCGREGTRATGSSDRVTLETRTAEGWDLAAAPSVLTAIGYRDGARTRARFTVADSLEPRLQVDLLVETNPLPVLVEGAWVDLDADGAGSGTLRAEDLHFLGGQGGRPSLGGRLTLEDAAGADRFRLVLPPVPLTPIRPGGLEPVGETGR